jgi:GNAT superfamily N-acetyltransferase
MELSIVQIDSENISRFAPYLSAENEAGIHNNTLRGIGAAVDDADCGAAVYDTEADAIRICDIFIDDAYRDLLVGSYLIDELIGFAEETGVSRVYTEFLEREEDPLPGKLFAGMNFEREEIEGWEFAVTVGNLDKYEIPGGESGGENSDILPLSKIDLTTRRAFENRLNELGLNPLGLHLDDPKEVIPEISVVSAAGRELKACLLLSPTNPSAEDKASDLTVTAFFLSDKSVKTFGALAKEAAARLQQLFHPETIVRIPLTAAGSLRLTQSVLGKAGQISAREVRYRFETGEPE